jgi:Putative outer membrane beta-barrel porin, MtrB/PioB
MRAGPEPPPKSRRGGPRPEVLLPALLLLSFARALQADSVPGYVLNPTGTDATRLIDPRGMTQFRETRRRTPTGFLYPYPFEPERLADLGAGWLGRASVDIGGLATAGDSDETRFDHYADWSENFLLNSFDVAFLHRDSGVYGEATGGGVGRDDAYYYGELGRLGWLRLRGSYSGIPFAYANDARNLYLGAGAEVLTLPTPLVPGNNSEAALETALAGIGESNLSVQRDALGLRLDVWPLASVKLFARYGLLERKGARPFGGSLLYETGFSGAARASETTQPLDDRTHEFSAGVEAARGWFAGNLSYNGSFYRNDDWSLTWDNPFLVGPLARGAANVQRGRFALAPDSDLNNLRGDLAIQLPADARFTATASWTRMRQDDDLLPPTVNTGTVGGFANAVTLDPWSTSAAVSRGGADATVDTLLVNGDLRVQPWRRLRIGARARYYERENLTDYTAFNPLTGQIGYIAEDGALAVGTPFYNRVFEPGRPSDDWRYRSTPFSHDQLELEASADYQLRAKTSLGLQYTWEQIERDHRERSWTQESRIRAEASSRDIPWATVRIAYEYGDRRGASYDSDPYGAYYVSSLAGFQPLPDPLPPFTLAQLRKYDLSNRQQQLADLRVNFLVREDMDVSVAARYEDDDYGADYGLEDSRSGSVNLEWSYQPTPSVTGYVFGSYERGENDMASINDAPALSNDPNAGGAVYPLANAWSVHTRDSGGSAGAGFWLRPLERVSLESSYRYVVIEQQLGYDFASASASASALAPGTSAAAAGSGFPALRTADHVLDTSVRLELTHGLAVRVFYRFQLGRIQDFQQDGLDAGLVAGSLFLGHVDRDFTAQVVGATIQLRYPSEP